MKLILNFYRYFDKIMPIILFYPKYMSKIRIIILFYHDYTNNTFTKPLKVNTNLSAF